MAGLVLANFSNQCDDQRVSLVSGQQAIITSVNVLSWGMEFGYYRDGIDILVTAV